MYEEHASLHGGCDLTVNSAKANWLDEDNAHGVVSAGLQEVSSVRRGETLKSHVAFDSKIASVSMKILALHLVVKEIVLPRFGHTYVHVRGVKSWRCVPTNEERRQPLLTQVPCHRR